MIKKAFIILILISISFVFGYKNGIILDFFNISLSNPFVRSVDVPDDYSKIDRNQNGIADSLDIVITARKEVEQRTKYESNYYRGGYPPDEEGVCTDVVWRGLFGADIDLKHLIDEDIANFTKLYNRVGGKPDPNIDFRRVPNQYVFFERHLEVLTTDLIPDDIDNLRQWQPGDIVLFLDGFHHVAIISDQRAQDGTPYIIHNNPPFASEIKLKSIKTPIAGHYRWKY